jgi:hypothetical protein
MLHNPVWAWYKILSIFTPVMGAPEANPDLAPFCDLVSLWPCWQSRDVASTQKPSCTNSTFWTPSKSHNWTSSRLVTWDSVRVGVGGHPWGPGPSYPIGVETGKCVPFNGSVKTCEVAAWCPVEDDAHMPKWVLPQGGKFLTLVLSLRGRWQEGDPVCWGCVCSLGVLGSGYPRVAP